MFTFSSPRDRDRLLREIELLAAALLRLEYRIATVESCTGGSVAAMFTELPGSSAWFDRGFVTYSNAAKEDMVGVRTETLRDYGAVSEQAALEMALGGVVHSAANCAVSITGVAGPGGGSAVKPVGMVCFAWAGFSSEALSETRYFAGDRHSVREQSVVFSIHKALKLLDINSPD
mgnify:CR=1 FL=1